MEALLSRGHSFFHRRRIFPLFHSHVSIRWLKVKDVSKMISSTVEVGRTLTVYWFLLVCLSGVSEVDEGEVIIRPLFTTSDYLFPVYCCCCCCFVHCFLWIIYNRCWCLTADGAVVHFARLFFGLKPAICSYRLQTQQ